MAKLSFYLDTRVQKKDGTFPVKLKLSHKTKTKLEKTGVDVKRNEWDEELGEIIGNHPMKKQHNLKLKRMMVQLQMSLLDIEAYRDVDNMSIDKLMNEIRQGAGFEIKTERHLFLPYYDAQIEKKIALHTKEKFITTRTHLMNFERHMELLTFEDITVEWLQKFDEWLAGPLMKRKPLAKNSRAANLRNIRAVVNAARMEKMTAVNPFENFKIGTEQTLKRALSIQEMHNFWNWEPQKEIQRFYKDMFKLTFMLVGINPIDIFYMKKEQIVAGRLDYRRSKTKKIYSLKIMPEAQELIDKYSGEDEHLLLLYSKYKGNEGSFKSAFTRNLKKFDKRLSIYWARHTWATTAGELDIPNEIISGALGHNIGAAVTRIYIRLDQRKIDKACRRVLDAVINNINPDDLREE